MCFVWKLLSSFVVLEIAYLACRRHHAIPVLIATFCLVLFIHVINWEVSIRSIYMHLHTWQAALLNKWYVNMTHIDYTEIWLHSLFGYLKWSHTYQSVWGSSITNNVLHRSLLYDCLEVAPLTWFNIDLVIPCKKKPKQFETSYPRLRVALNRLSSLHVLLIR